LLLPEPGHKGIFRGPLKVYSWFSRPKTQRGPIEIQQGDLLILPDAYWAHREIWPAVERARERGAYVVSVVFDLIPRTHPSFVADGAAEAFDEYLSNVVENSDLMIAISNTVRNQLETLVPSIRQSDSGCRHFRSFELGAEFRQVGGFVRPEIKKVFSEDGIDNPHLMVSTFDPRKNHMYLLDAFDRIWAEDPTRKLCLIGRIGWLCQDVLERIWSHPLFSRQLFAFHDVSDEELSYCYQKSRSICFPSIVEGFGLPIVEALWYGKHVFASDTEIHREVGKDECHYCDLNDSNDLAIKLLAWERMYGPQSPSRQSSVRPITWRASIQSLLSQCLECYAQDQMRRPRIAA
jgi:alpha-1,2-rhamnosyltransferase